MTKTKLIKITDRIDALEKKVRRLNRLIISPDYGQILVKVWVDLKN